MVSYNAWLAQIRLEERVLILIVVDNGLVLANVLIDGVDGARVLILVVVDNGLVQYYP